VFTSRIWKELFRHSRLDDSVGGVIALLAEELGISGIAIRTLDVKQATWTTVAQASAGTWSVLPPAHNKCTAKQMQQILSWVRSREILVAHSTVAGLLGTIVGANLNADVAVGPLGNEEDDSPVGALVLLAQPGSMTDRHPTEIAALLEPFQVALAASRRIQELGRLREMFEAENRTLLSKLNRQEVMGTIVGADAGFKEVMDRVEQVAAADVPVLLLGETGTGKEVVARELHSRSRRNQGPMLRVNCGAIPPGLVDSELFGHERGSFTGAVAARAGWFERADGGTLFLDEIGELDPSTQAKLLRVLERNAFRRVGGTALVNVDLSVVAATNRNLEEAIAAKRFREDLYYRLKVVTIVVPPVRDRREDIPALVESFIADFNRRNGGKIRGIEPQAIRWLSELAWPGNVRELKNAVESAALLATSETIRLEEFESTTTSRRTAAVPSRASVPPSPALPADSIVVSAKATLTDVERVVISEHMRRATTKIAAARTLGIGLRTLYSKIRRYQIGTKV